MAIITEQLTTPQNQVFIQTFENNGDTKTINAIRHCIILLIGGSIEISIDGVVNSYVAPMNFTTEANKTLTIKSTQDNTKLVYCLSSFQSIQQ